MELTGIILALCATVSWAACVFPFTIAGRVMTVATMNLFRLVAGTVLVGMIALFSNHLNFIAVFSSGYAQAWLWFGLSGVVALGIGDYFNYRMYVILGPRHGSVLTTFSPAAALLFGYLLLQERINVIGLAGIFITISGVMGMSLGRSERSTIIDHGHGSIVKGMVFGIIAALCTGAGLAFSKFGFVEQQDAAKTIEPLTASFIRFIISTVIVILITFFNRKLNTNWKQFRVQKPKTIRIAFLGVVFGPVLGVGFALSSIQYINVAVSQTIFALVPVVALVIAHFYLKEKITRNALVGAFIAIIGVAVLAWRNELVELFT